MNRHSMLWRAPGRRDEEHKLFAALMRKVEAVRVREGLSKRALAAKIGTNKGALHNWLSGRALGRRETVEKIKAFLESREIAKVSGTARR